MSQEIGVIGAGVMGKGVAQRFAQYGFKVILLDVREEILEAAANELRRNLKLAGMFQKSVDVNKIMDNISTSSSYGDLSNVDFIVENVTEDKSVKKNVYEELEKAGKKDCIFMADTSCIPITLIGSFTKRPEKVIGVHFMNPVPMKDFTEVIKGRLTSEETVENTVKLLSAVNISAEVVNDGAGFVSNRLSHLFMNEAAFLVYEHVATAEQIDTIFKKGFGHKMGPLETADLIGLDTVLYSLKVLYEQYEDTKFRACPLLKQMVQAGMFGRKSGKGFYEYQ